MDTNEHEFGVMRYRERAASSRDVSGPVSLQPTSFVFIRVHSWFLPVRPSTR